MLIGSRQRLSTRTESPTFAINDFEVSQVTTAKSLGVTIDDRLDWSGHIEKVTKKVASGIGAIKRIRHLVPQATLQLIYQALIQPHFDYCNIVSPNHNYWRQLHLSRTNEWWCVSLTSRDVKHYANKCITVILPVVLS